ncbi:hypothetical protein FQN49_006501 [Arthroderma sp. PD_2]|nr:hypothetical protein FQN49_006501 [Arthroderma sp. PD_2]
MGNITWNESADAKLLFAIISTSVTRIDYAAVAKILGNECTPNAIKHRLARIKSKMDLFNDKASSPSTTPVKLKRGRPKKCPVEDDEDDENAIQKKVKKETD